jgi:hypothetical protein
VVLDSEHDMMLVEDLAADRPRPGRSHPLDCSARIARFAPDSDAAIVLEAMRHARFALWRVERRPETAGLILPDRLRGGAIWLADETMEKSAPCGVEMAVRLLQPESCAMTARILGPVTSDLMEDIHQGSRLAAHPGRHSCPEPALCDRHRPRRRAQRNNGFWPLQTLIGASFMQANAALSLTQNRQSPTEEFACLWDATNNPSADEKKPPPVSPETSIGADCPRSPAG